MLMSLTKSLNIILGSGSSMNAKLFAISINPWTYKAGGGVDAIHPRKYFQNFEKMIYSKGLKLSLAVHSSVTDILICQLCVHHFFCFHSSHWFHVGLAKNQHV